MDILGSVVDGGLKSAIKMNQHLLKFPKQLKMDYSCFCSNKADFIGDGAPNYAHLGAGCSQESLRIIMEHRTKLSGSAIRFEKLIYTPKEGKTKFGCPIAKWVLRRTGPNEKYLVLIRHRHGHICETAWIIMAIVAYEGLPLEQSDQLYEDLCFSLDSKVGIERGCRTNKSRTCSCQGTEKQRCGESFSFGCSYSEFTKGCKFARCPHAFPNKYKLSDRRTTIDLEKCLNSLADSLAPLNYQLVPESHHCQTYFEEVAGECRLGSDIILGRPWSGVTVCMDFCAHAHRDRHNMDNGTTIVLTLTKHRGTEKPKNEQLHVLPMYILDSADETMEARNIELLKPVLRTVYVRTEPLERKGKEKNTSRNSTLPKPKKLKTWELSVLRDLEFGHQISRRITSGHALESFLTSTGVGDVTNIDSLPFPNTFAKLKGSNSTPIQPIEGINVKYTDDEYFDDCDVGGVSLALPHGSVLFECAKAELHATTPLGQAANRNSPTRIGVVFYQHKNLNLANHGHHEYELWRSEVNNLNKSLCTPIKSYQMSETSCARNSTSSITGTT